jgi:hypothetical protein
VVEGIKKKIEKSIVKPNKFTTFKSHNVKDITPNTKVKRMLKILAA